MGMKKKYLISMVILLALLCVSLFMCSRDKGEQPIDGNSNNKIEGTDDSDASDEGGIATEEGGIGYDEDFEDFMSDNDDAKDSRAEDDNQQNSSQKDDTQKNETQKDDSQKVDDSTEDNIPEGGDLEEDKELPEGELEKGSWGLLF